MHWIRKLQNTQSKTKVTEGRNRQINNNSQIFQHSALCNW